jgi:hypothetical protein
MDRTQKKVQVLIGRARLAEQKRQRNRSIGIAATLALFTLVLFGMPLLTGCSETYVSPTVACCTDTCDAIHTCDSNTGCTDDCATESTEKVFTWICKNGKQKKIYEFNLNDWIKKGWTHGKCDTPPPGDDDDDDVPPGDDDDDDGDNKVCICHIPPGNPSNAHTICIGEPAVAAHIANHGDYLGECK